MDSSLLLEMCSVGGLAYSIRVLSGPAEHTCENRHQIRMVRALRLECAERTRVLEGFILGPRRQWVLVSLDLINWIRKWFQYDTDALRATTVGLHK